MSPRKRKTAGDSSGTPLSKKPMTDTNLDTPPTTVPTQILYSDVVDDKENPTKAGKEKMLQSIESMRYDKEHAAVTNEQGSTVLQRIKNMDERMQKLEATNKNVNESIQKLEATRRRYMDVRQRTLCSWVRDAYGKDQEKRKEDIRRLNKEIIHAGDVRSDAILFTERFHATSSERTKFPDLYGLNAETVKELDQEKCYRSLQALDRAATILIDRSHKELPEDRKKDREALVALLQEKKYEDAEKMSDTIVWE